MDALMNPPTRGPQPSLRRVACAPTGPDGLGQFESLLRDACRPAMMSRGAVLALAAIATSRRCAPGEAVLRRTQSAGSLWLLAGGTVALGVLGERGWLQRRRSIEAGSWVDAASALLSGPYLEDAVAESDVMVWELPMAQVLHRGCVHPALMRALATALATQWRQVLVGTRGLMTKDVLARCATWLIEHARTWIAADGRGVGEVGLRQRKRAVALELGTTAESFSRTLAQLRSLGLVAVHGYTIELLDLDALRRVADAQGDGRAVGARCAAVSPTWRAGSPARRSTGC
ncbi:MAG: Crp/Fnr family transcriptional regulator [Burkholderiaceae bacterium]